MYNYTDTVQLQQRAGPRSAAKHAAKRSNDPAFRCSDVVPQILSSHIQIMYTVASDVLAGPTYVLKGSCPGGEPAMKESEQDVGRLKQLELKADENYLVEKLPLEDYIGKVPRGVEECHEYHSQMLTFHISQIE